MPINIIKTLLVEDEKAFQRLMEAFLTEASVRGLKYEVTGAETLARTLELLRTNTYDVIMCDLSLPDSFGLDTFTAVATGAADTPVLVLTGLENAALGEVAVGMGAQDYLLKKDVTVEMLSRAIMYSIERKSIEVSLRASEERYRALIDSLDDSIVVVDRELNIIMANRAFKHAYRPGYSAPDVTGRRFPEAVSALPEKSLGICRQAIEEGKTAKMEASCVWNDRQSVLEIKCVPMADGGGRTERAVIVARDVTERKQMEQMKDDFASLVSHELRSPLTSIVAGLGIVLEDWAGKMDEGEKKLLAIAYKDAQRLDRIICKLLEMSRLEAGTSKFKKTIADVVELADEAVSRFASRAISRNIELRKNYPEGKIVATLDTDGISEVFTNLLSNALKFTEKGSVEIGVAEKEDLIECYVKDTGTGISKENQAKLFTKFKQFGKPVVEDEKGTGLGLFIAKEILRRHNGTLSVSSEPGKGTTFSFTLPKCAKEETAEARGK